MRKTPQVLITARRRNNRKLASRKHVSRWRDYLANIVTFNHGFERTASPQTRE